MPDDAASLPFVPPGATLTASGRQALSLVAQELRARGITDLLAPTYHCPTMIEPFQLEGIHVELVAVGEDLLLDPRALAATLAGRRPCGILHAETAGHLAGPALAAVLAAAREGGHAVVVDETHSFLDRPEGIRDRPADGSDGLVGASDQPTTSPELPTGGPARHSGGPARPAGAPQLPAGVQLADYRVASLRKWLPLPDGAWVTGVPPRPLTRREADDAVTFAGLAALAAEDEGEDAGAGEDAGELWARAEDLVDRAIAPAAMSPQARDLLARLDVDDFLRRHRAAGSPISFHWPRPRSLPSHLSWPGTRPTA